MKISKDLYLVMQVKRDDGSFIHVHAKPIDAQVFDSYMGVLADTYGYFIEKPSRVSLGPRLAHKQLLVVARELGGDQKAEEVKAGLMGEIRRLTNVSLFTGSAWESMPYYDALQRKLFEPEDVDEIEGRLTFFTAASHLLPRINRLALLDGAMKMWGARTTSLPFTEYQSSLPTSTAPENTGETQTAASSGTS